MPTSSITKDFIIEGEEQAKRFIAAWEASEKDKEQHHAEPDIDVTFIEDSEELKQFMKFALENQNKR